MLKKMWIVLLFAFCFARTHGQFVGELDTIDFNKLTSENVVLLSTKDSLFSILGEPQRVLSDLYAILFKYSNGEVVRDTTLFYNSFDYYNELGLDYIEKEGRVRLQSVDFAKNKSIKIVHPLITIDSSLKLKDLSKNFPISYQRKGIYEPEILPYVSKDKKNYCVWFYSGGKHEGLIEIYFDKKKKIRFVDFGFNDW